LHTWEFTKNNFSACRIHIPTSQGLWQLWGRMSNLLLTRFVKE
jgi:hypothetical protein